jgi:hypothetical protein
LSEEENLIIYKSGNQSPTVYCIACACIYIKGIGSILFFKSGLKKVCRKNYKNNLISNIYGVCTVLACWFPNILDLMVLENIKISLDKTRRPPWWSSETDLDFCHQSATYDVSSVYFNHTLISYVCDGFGSISQHSVLGFFRELYILDFQFVLADHHWRDMNCRMRIWCIKIGII